MEKKKDNIIVAFLRVAMGCTLGLVLTVFTFQDLLKVILRSVKMLRAGVVAPAYILSDVFLGFALLSFSGLFLRFGFGNKLRGKITYGQIGLIFLFSILGGAAMSIIDDAQKDKFEWPAYAPYVEDMPVQSMYEVCDVDYSGDRVCFSSYLNFIYDTFRKEGKVEVQQDDRYTDSARIEIYYRGVECEMYVSDYDPQNIYINMWEVGFDSSEMSDEDIIYMYKYGINMEYTDKYAVDKIIIRTAYPEKVDISGIENSLY